MVASFIRLDSIKANRCWNRCCTLRVHAEAHADVRCKPFGYEEPLHDELWLMTSLKLDLGQVVKTTASMRTCLRLAKQHQEYTPI
uniref:Uncharacterized protein n=1 Tax=Ascaris lumbricoides TaxID=6252 RepID=A0A0M3I685_ASCLU